MQIELKPVDKDNWQQVIRLSVPPEQQEFVASNLYSLAESRFYPELEPLAIYCDGRLVGFLMHGFDDGGARHWITRLMVTSNEQNKGIGRRAMQEIIERIRQTGAPAIYLSFEPENTAAEHLYRSLGFLPTGEVLEGELVFRLQLNSG